MKHAISALVVLNPTKWRSLLAAGCLLLCAYANAVTTTITVTTTADSGPGSLRAAVEAANATTDDVRIDLTHLPQPSVITLTNGRLNFSAGHQISLVGPGMDLLSISGNLTHNILFMNSGTFVGVSDITLRDGRGNNGGAVISGGDTVFTRVAFRNNKASDVTGARGGAILASGNEFFFRCIFQDNESTFLGGAIYFSNYREGTVINSTFLNNTALWGGAISVGYKNVTIKNSTFTENTAAFEGGAIDSDDSGTKQPVNIVNTTIANNFAGVRGGGVSNRGAMPLNLANTIVANNKAGLTVSDIVGDIFSQGHNLVSNAPGSMGLNAFCGTSPADLIGMDPKLSPLHVTAAGGLPVLVPTPDSPAVNAIAIGTGACDGINVQTIDQRGISRPQGGRADIGAVEVIPEDDRIFCSSLDGVACKSP